MLTTILVQTGTLTVGDFITCRKTLRKGKSHADERGKKVMSAGPSAPVSVLGLERCATGRRKFRVYEDEREAKQIASKRSTNAS